MIKRTFAISSFLVAVCGSLSVFGVGGLAACSGDDDSVAPNVDGSAIDTDATASGDDGGSSVAPATWVLATSGTTNSELVAVNVGTHTVDGRFAFAGAFGAPFNGGSAPFLLESAVSKVGKLQASAPWNVTSSWDVTSGSVAGQTYSNPQAIVVSADTKACVLLNTRNVIDVIDPSQTVTDGAPSKSIDLSSLLQTAGGDADGLVDVQAGFYDAKRQRLWVVLENISREVQPLPCTNTQATLVAVDTTTDTLVDLGGKGPGGAYVFSLFDPLGVAFDGANDRVVTANFGCQAAASADAGADAGPGALQKNGIEILSLADGTSSTFLETPSAGRGAALALVGNDQAVVVFDDPVTFAGNAEVIDLTSKTIVSNLPTAPDSFVSDGNGNLYGTMYGTFADGGSGENIVEVNVADGGVTTLATAPFTDPTGYVGGVALWSNQ